VDDFEELLDMIVDGDGSRDINSRSRELFSNGTTFPMSSADSCLIDGVDGEINLEGLLDDSHSSATNLAHGEQFPHALPAAFISASVPTAAPVINLSGGSAWTLLAADIDRVDSEIDLDELLDYSYSSATNLAHDEQFPLPAAFISASVPTAALAAAAGSTTLTSTTRATTALAPTTHASVTLSTAAGASTSFAASSLTSAPVAAAALATTTVAAASPASAAFISASVPTAALAAAAVRPTPAIAASAHLSTSFSTATVDAAVAAALATALATAALAPSITSTVPSR